MHITRSQKNKKKYGVDSRRVIRGCGVSRSKANNRIKIELEKPDTKDMEWGILQDTFWGQMLHNTRFSGTDQGVVEKNLEMQRSMKMMGENMRRKSGKR